MKISKKKSGVKVSVITSYICIGLSILLFCFSSLIEVKSDWILRATGFLLGISMIASCYGIYLKYVKKYT